MEDHDLDLLHALFDYDPSTGTLLWKQRTPDMFKGGLPAAAKRWNAKFAGKRVGSVTGGGYLSSVLFGRRFMVHRMVWVLCHNRPIPEGAQVDHINGNPADNRANNLRLCTPHENQANKCVRVQTNLRGAFFHKPTGKWQASIRLHLGTYETEEAAAAAYEEAAERIHRDFYLRNGRRPSVSRVR